jgi:RND family efflux transporter MFP subunit
MEVPEPGRMPKRLFGGVVRAADRADLAFRIAGRVADLNVDIGDSVRQGGVLARLDPAIPQLRQQQATATVSRVEASLEERRRRLDVQQRLYTAGHTTLQSLRAAALEVSTGEAELRDAHAALALATRDVADSALVAPHDGVVAAREVERNSEVSAGQIVLRIDGTGTLEVASSLPANLVESARVGTRVEVSVTAVPFPLIGIVSRIGGRGESGLSFPVIVTLPPEARDRGVRPGMVVDLLLAGGGDADLIVPLTAVVPGSEAGRGHVFVLSSDGRSVVRRAITVGGVGDDGVRVRAGLSAGERIVSVGAAFLSDGAAVRPLAAR